jgi:leucyl-tRNA synthetase
MQITEQDLKFICQIRILCPDCVKNNTSQCNNDYINFFCYEHKKEELVQCQYCRKFLINGKWVFYYDDKSWEINHQPCPTCLEKQIKIINEELGNNHPA